MNAEQKVINELLAITDAPSESDLNERVDAIMDAYLADCPADETQNRRSAIWIAYSEQSPGQVLRSRIKSRVLRTDLYGVT